MAYKVIATPVADQGVSRNSIAGTAWMPQGTSTPVCKCCQSPMQLFVQFDIEQRFLPQFEDGSHLVLFMCPKCNEIPSFDNFAGRTLPANYWEKTEGNHYVALYRPGSARTAVQGSNFLLSFNLGFGDDVHELQHKPYIGVGGDPQWMQAEEKFSCACGGQMRLLTQISENFSFPKLPFAPPQPDSFSKDDYCLFLGNEVYVFGCERQCNDHAVWITVQN